MTKPAMNIGTIAAILGKPPKATPPITPGTTMFGGKDDDYDLWGGYGSHGKTTDPYSRYSKVVTTAPKTTQKKIGVVYPNGVVDTYYLTWESEGWFPFGAEWYALKDDKLQIPVDRCDFTYTAPKFNPCVFTATNDYMQARWGRKLDDTDRRWLASHPLATDNGVPQEYTATCIDQLVSPYGLRVARVRLRAGSLVLGESITAWMQALGVNPFAMADRKTSNAEAAAKMGMTLDAANALWRCEFSEQPLPCSIIGERGWTNGNGVSTGSYGGHARYLAPRGAAGDWFISAQLDTDDRVQYLVPPPDPEYVERLGDPTLIVGKIKQPTGDALIAIKTNTKWHRPDEAPPVTTATVVTPNLVPTTPKADSPPKTVEFDPWPDPAQDRLAFDKKVMEQMEGKQSGFVCECCNSRTLLSEAFEEYTVCMLCVEEAWVGMHCPDCDVSLTAKPPIPTATTDQYEWECVRCGSAIGVPFVATTADERRLVPLCDELFAQMFANEMEAFDENAEGTDSVDGVSPLALGVDDPTDFAFYFDQDRD